MTTLVKRWGYKQDFCQLPVGVDIISDFSFTSFLYFYNKCIYFVFRKRHCYCKVPRKCTVVFVPVCIPGGGEGGTGVWNTVVAPRIC